MHMMNDVKGAKYSALMKSLFSNCDTISCIVREQEESERYFEEIQYMLLEEKFVTEWPLTKTLAPVLQYTFPCNFTTQQFFIARQPSLYSWILPEPEDLSFMKDGKVIFATCTHEQLVYIDENFQKELAHVFK